MLLIRNPRRNAKNVLKKIVVTYAKAMASLIDEQLTSQVMATPFQVNFHGVRYPMAGIGYVASYPEYRGEGGISAIMKEMLADLAETKRLPFLT